MWVLNYRAIHNEEGERLVLLYWVLVDRRLAFPTLTTFHDVLLPPAIQPYLQDLKAHWIENGTWAVEIVLSPNPETMAFVLTIKTGRIADS